MVFTKTTLPNGMRLVMAPNPQSMAATALVLVEAGSNYETKEINGLSHFLEHLCFKGTTNRPTAFAISSELDALGAQYNAFTSNEYTGYFAKVQPARFEKALEIVADLYQNPLFDAGEIEKEKGVIVEEINMYEDLPQRKVQELASQVLYGDQPAGWPIAGEKEVVRGLTRDDFTHYRDKQYVASSTLVVLAGAFDSRAAEALVFREFANIGVGEKQGKVAVDDRQTAPRALVEYKDSDQTHLVVAVRGYSVSHPDHHVAEVLAATLGGGMSSRLFQRVREQMGAAYYVRASHDALTDHGFLQAAAGAENLRAREVVRAIVEEFERIRKDGVVKEELRMVKDMLIGTLYLDLETSDHLASFFGIQETLKREILSPDEYVTRLEAVSLEDMARVANNLFVPERMNLAIIGPTRDEHSFAELLAL